MSTFREEEVTKVEKDTRGFVAVLENIFYRRLFVQHPGKLNNTLFTKEAVG